MAPKINGSNDEEGFSGGCFICVYDSYIYIAVGGITTEHLCVLRRRILDLLIWTIISPRVDMKSNF